ncbi:hypothetical protein HN928_03400 [bacterium]|jgi:Zn finger protein HypA/HybF involved in hydrogenase expression|nr:hypothetical protein [bacterium]
MGSIIRAHCKCGFESEDIYAGGGMMNFHEICNAPAICLHCNTFLIKNYMKKYSKCPKCRKKVTFYNDSQVQEKVSESDESYYDIFSWDMEEKGTFFLLNIQYYCPKCKKKSLKFVDIGNWD